MKQEKKRGIVRNACAAAQPLLPNGLIERAAKRAARQRNFPMIQVQVPAVFTSIEVGIPLRFSVGPSGGKRAQKPQPEDQQAGKNQGEIEDVRKRQLYHGLTSSRTGVH